MVKRSITYKILGFLGIHLSLGTYGNISFLGALKKALKHQFNAIILKYCMYSTLLSPLNYRIIRPKLWKLMGVKIGKKVFIGYDVWIDFNHTHLIEIEDGAHVTNRCLLLCHQRDLKNYKKGFKSTDLPYKKGKIIIRSNAMIGMGTIILPNVEIGEGSIIAAGSIVTKNIPPWSVAGGSPARVIKKIEN